MTRRDMIDIRVNVHRSRLEINQPDKPYPGFETQSVAIYILGSVGERHGAGF